MEAQLEQLIGDVRQILVRLETIEAALWRSSEEPEDPTLKVPPLPLGENPMSPSASEALFGY